MLISFLKNVGNVENYIFELKLKKKLLRLLMMGLIDVNVLTIASKRSRHKSCEIYNDPNVWKGIL